jgi:hypothetical protein
VTAEGLASRAAADGTGAIVIVLVYALVGPPIGAVLLAPLAGLIQGQVAPTAFFGGLLLLAGTFPFSLLLAYYFAGLPALCTGVCVAASARRRGAVPYWIAGASAVGAVLLFQVFAHWTGTIVFGAAVARVSAWSAGGFVLILTGMAASLLCCALTRPLQRRVRLAAYASADGKTSR